MPWRGDAWQDSMTFHAARFLHLPAVAAALHAVSLSLGASLSGLVINLRIRSSGLGWLVGVEYDSRSANGIDGQPPPGLRHLKKHKALVRTGRFFEVLNTHVSVRSV